MKRISSNDPVILGHSLNDYRFAYADIGPLAYTWSDKPHRLVFDLCIALEDALNHIEALKEMIGQTSVELIEWADQNGVESK